MPPGRSSEAGPCPTAARSILQRFTNHSTQFVRNGKRKLRQQRSSAWISITSNVRDVASGLNPGDTVSTVKHAPVPSSQLARALRLYLRSLSDFGTLGFGPGFGPLLSSDPDAYCCHVLGDVLREGRMNPFGHLGRFHCQAINPVRSLTRDLNSSRIPFNLSRRLSC
jgi:hypothetical protein